MQLEFNGLPGIEEFLSSKGDGLPVEVSELDHVAEAIVAQCGITKEQSNRILSLFFQEIRSAMLRGEVIDIRGLGTFFVSSPRTTENKKRVFSKFRPKKTLIKRMNYERSRA